MLMGMIELAKIKKMDARERERGLLELCLDRVGANAPYPGQTRE